jgi:hypothetical protein
MVSPEQCCAFFSMIAAEQRWAKILLFLPGLPGVGCEPGSSRFHLFSHFLHFTAEPQRLPHGEPKSLLFWPKKLIFAKSTPGANPMTTVGIYTHTYNCIQHWHWSWLVLLHTVRKYP